MIGIRSNLFLALLLILSSCSIENKLAKEQVQELQNASVLLIFPDTLLFQNSKPYQFPENLSDEVLAIAAIDSSFFLKNISASQYLSDFSKMINALYQSYGFQVYNQYQWDEFLAHKQKLYIVEFTQLQLEEYWQVYTDTEIMPDDYEYSQSFDLNALSMNAWISVAKINDTASEKNLIYSESVIKDELSGLFLMNNISGEVYYDYNFNPLKPEDAIGIIENSSVKIGMDVFDFLINNYVEKGMLEIKGYYPDRFWKFVPNRNNATPSYKKSGYIIIE